MKEGAQNLAQKAKEKVEDLANKTKETAHNVKVRDKENKNKSTKLFFRKKFWAAI